MELFLGTGQFLAALAVAVLTWKLTKYTKELVKAQRASNRVLKSKSRLELAFKAWAPHPRANPFARSASPQGRTSPSR